ncbi:MATE family efflux transporter [Butyrivibrio sp. YAB3001]|uniref:MATE family efflux transporter n=1 Tax=Butyrivibrio sp. YAB3001 TaxID=1520812 RepID=UPI0008F62098|nr:MATE family efflux transporter [Butyrivibrio sp. YAB3001]SFB88558.1 putative efflux protein, MATE family [Butyrivibrio sp. YAB3001]
MFETSNREEAIKVKFPLKEALIGDAAFYRRVAMVVVPMIIQNTLSNVVGLLDNIMVGQVGTLAMSSVAIVNQILFVFYLCIWGSLAGAGIFSTQFFGKGDMEGVRAAIRFKLLTAITILGIASLILISFGGNIISLYIAEGTVEADRIQTMKLATGYLDIMIVGLIPFSLTQVYASAMRESGKTTLPMIAGMVAMGVNFIFNALLIFGLFGFPKLGVFGAAIATVISRFSELLMVVYGAHKGKTKYQFFKGLYRHFVIPLNLIWPILSKTLPLLANEFLWSLSQATLLQAYSIRGIAVIAAMNISGTISQIFNEVFLSLGNSTGIIVGQELGANKLVSARRTAWRMAALSLASTVVMGTLLSLAAPFIPQLYNTEPEIRSLATRYIMIVAMVMPINAYANVAYFTLRSGGKTTVTFLFDSCFSWLVPVPCAYVLSRFTNLPAISVFTIVSLLEFIKCIIGFILVKSGVWVRNIVSGK